MKEKAFPIIVDSETEIAYIKEGHDLRDHFAGLAMQGIIVNKRNDLTIDDMANLAYQYAEAMMKARKTAHETLD